MSLHWLQRQWCEDNVKIDTRDCKDVNFFMSNDQFHFSGAKPSESWLIAEDILRTDTLH
jgi:hypothetical protein